APAPGPVLLPISARGPEALQALAHRYRELLRDGGDGALTARDVARAAALRRSHHDHRVAVVGASRDELVQKLDDVLAGRAAPGLAASRGAAHRPATDPVFVFSGMGPQWWAMGRQLLQTEPVFRARVEECDALLRRHADWSLLAEMTRDHAASRMEETRISQPANFALQVGLAALWAARGIRPAAVVGHSTGEVAACHVAGMLDLDEAVRVIFHRSRLQQRASGLGRMAAVGLPAADAEAAIRAVADRVSIAAVNTPRSVTLAGDTEVLEPIVAGLAARGVFTRFLAVQVPFHSHHMEPLRPELLECLAGLRARPAAVPFYSTVTGERAPELVPDAAYWWRNVRHPVLFAAAVERLIADGHAVFLEVGPHPVLSSLVSDSLTQHRRQGHVVASLRRDADEPTALLSSLATLYTLGYPVDWPALYGPGAPFVRLPSYPWQRERHWHESPASLDSRLGRLAHPLLGRRLPVAAPTWEADVDPR
ncbi:MAG TPA: acyltransferase domain-containing protein, partial [Methylomirabilota bacterium]|nr:acyltransferase domain-containing protein [Methylomirabilota bacterium]